MDDVLITLVPCDGAVENGKWNVIGVFDRWITADVPVRVNPFHVLVRAQGVPLNEEFEIGLQLVKVDMSREGADLKPAWKQAIKATMQGQLEDVGIATLSFCMFVADIKNGNEAHPITLGDHGIWELQGFFNGRLRGAILIPVVRPVDRGDE